MGTHVLAGSSPYNTRPCWKVEKRPLAPKKSNSRKGPKARSWTSEEEAYLVESRSTRIPYRRIASQLGKSELACRLHYHQLTVAKQQQSPAANPSSQDVCDSAAHSPLIARSSLPNTPVVTPRTQTQYLPPPVKQLPSLAALLPSDVSHHRRCQSLPCFFENCSFPSDHESFHPMPMLPPPRRLLSPFRPTQMSSTGVRLGSAQDVFRDSPEPDHLPTSSLSWTPVNEVRSWTRGSSRSSSISSLTSMWRPSTSSSSSSYTATSSERCSVQALLNHNTPSTV